MEENELEVNGVTLLACLFMISLIAGFIFYIDEDYFIGEFLLASAFVIILLFGLSSFLENYRAYIFGIASIFYPLILMFVVNRYYTEFMDALDFEGGLYIIYAEISLLSTTFQYWKKKKRINS